MDLGLIFGLNSRFGAVLGRIPLRFRTAFCAYSPNSLVYQRVTGGCGFSDCLKTALRLCRTFSDQRSLSHWLSCAAVRVVTGWCDEKCQSGLVWGIPLLPLEKRLRTTRNRGMVPATSRAPLRLSPSTSLGASAKAGQAFSKSVRRGAPPIVSLQRFKKPALHFPR